MGEGIQRVASGRRRIPSQVGSTTARRTSVSALLAGADLLTSTALLLAVSGATAIGPDPWQALAAALVWGIALGAVGAWHRDVGSAGVRPVLRAGIVLALALWLAGGLLAPDLLPDHEVGMVAALVVTALAVRLVVGARALRVAVIGDPDDLTPLLAELRRDRRRWDVTGVHIAVDEPEELADAALRSGATAVVLAPGRTVDPLVVRRVCWAADRAGLAVFVDTGILDVAPSRVRHLAVGVRGLAQVRSRTAPSAPRLAKNVTDRTVAALALFALLPLMGAIALAIRWDSPGKALYRQHRTGLDGRTFTMYKFRTMRSDADRQLTALAAHNDCDDVLFKMREDPRVTAVGRVLRRYSLDELPQLVNVVRGEMSLVGPRPALPAEVAQYARDPRRRLAVKPGLTGLWQVSGRSDLTWEESVRLDLHYVDNWSWPLDLHIIGRTVRAVVGHRGAY